MTELRKPVRREIWGLLREDLILTIYPRGTVGIRAKRTRREYTLPLVTIYRLAIEADQARARAERAMARGRRPRVSRWKLHQF